MNKSGQFDLFDLFSQPEPEPSKVTAPAPVAVVAAIAPEPVIEPEVELTPEVAPEVAVATKAAPETSELAPETDTQAPAEPVVKATKAKKGEEPVVEAPAEELIIFTLTSASNHPLTIQELTMGDPAKRKGYLGKHRGVWLTYLVSANAFNRMSEEAKADMRGRLQAEMEGCFA